MCNKVLRLLMLSTFVLAAYACGGKGGESDDTPEPYIESIVTWYDGKVVAGEPVTLNGQNFSSVASENKVLYGVGLDAIALRVDESSESHVTFTAPTVESTQLKVRVSTKGKESNAVTLDFIEKPVPEEPWDDTPTIDFVKLGGTSKTIVDGVEWISFHGSWEGQVRNINIVRTTLNEHNSLGIFYDYGDTYGNLDQKCEYLDAIEGTNGPMKCCHFVRVDGVVKRAAVETDKYFVSNCALTIDDNVPDIVKVKDNYAAARLSNKNVGCAGPLLVYEGKIQEYPEDNTAEFLKTTHPRTAIGISKDQKTVVQVAVDGRWTSSNTAQRAIGMPTPLLSKLMLGLGCYKAMNFDGGGGTAMWIYGEGDKGVVNHPCDGLVWDEPQAHLRKCGNAVYIKSDLKK